MQFNRTDDGVMHKLPKPSVDTGMGLERLAACCRACTATTRSTCSCACWLLPGTRWSAAGGTAVDADSPSLKVIADHIRACTFTVADGVIPGNEGRGYVLRRIARRGIRHGYKLGARKPFFYTLVAPLAVEMGEAYPELRREMARATEVLRQEEERFFQTIANGMEILEGALAGGAKVVDGDVAFKLHDTYGFPLDLTADVCRERGVTVDEAGFNIAMTRQREQARAAGKFKMATGLDYKGAATTFHGYEHLVCETSRVTAIYVDGTSVPSAKAGDDVVVVLDHTPFYAESGGQAGDTGELRNATARMLVEDTIKIQAAVHGHQGRIVEGSVRWATRWWRAWMASAAPHRAQPQRHAPDAQGAARGAGRARAAEGFARERRAHALRLRPQRTGQRRADRAGRGAGQCRDPGQRRHAGAGAAHRRSPQARRDDAVRREVRR
jgi:alanyl-tRNA synthetase